MVLVMMLVMYLCRNVVHIRVMWTFHGMLVHMVRMGMSDVIALVPVPFRHVVAYRMLVRVVMSDVCSMMSAVVVLGLLDSHRYLPW